MPPSTPHAASHAVLQYADISVLYHVSQCVSMYPHYVIHPVYMYMFSVCIVCMYICRYLYTYLPLCPAVGRSGCRYIGIPARSLDLARCLSMYAIRPRIIIMYCTMCLSVFRSVAQSHHVSRSPPLPLKYALHCHSVPTMSPSMLACAPFCHP